MALLAAPGQAGLSTDARLGYRYEPGVESKLLTELAAELRPLACLRTDAGVSFNWFQHNGLAAAQIGFRAALFEPVGLAVRAAVQHQQWIAWRAGENRMLALLEAGPVYRLEPGFGLVRRAPVFGEGRYGSPFVWPSSAAEWNLQYRLLWTLVQRDNWRLQAGFSTYDRFTAANPQQLPFRVGGDCRLKNDLELVASAGTAMVGFSGGIPSLHELVISLGVRYAWAGRNTPGTSQKAGRPG